MNDEVVVEDRQVTPDRHYGEIRGGVTGLIRVRSRRRLTADGYHLLLGNMLLAPFISGAHIVIEDADEQYVRVTIGFGEELSEKLLTEYAERVEIAIAHPKAFLKLCTNRYEINYDES